MRAAFCDNDPFLSRVSREKDIRLPDDVRAGIVSGSGGAYSATKAA